MRDRIALIVGIVLISALVAFVSGARATAQTSVWFKGTAQARHVRPSTLWLSGDGTLEVYRVRWSRWGGRVAVGTGVAKYHGCLPFCFNAPRHSVTVTVRLWNVVNCLEAFDDGPFRDQDFYNRVTLYTRHRTAISGPNPYNWAPCLYAS